VLFGDSEERTFPIVGLQGQVPISLANTFWTSRWLAVKVNNRNPSICLEENTTRLRSLDETLAKTEGTP
jgi:hypothetical protein